MSFLSSISKALYRGATRRPLTPKHGNKNFYKGTGSGAMGRHVRRGAYRINPRKVREFVVPDLTGFKLQPYVSWTVPKSKYSITVDSFLQKESASEAATTEASKL
ncbi:mitochondrial ribosomal protein L27-domain-containing protein [Paraphysoderma sedebokerense]|nr:mitochondrial ribosomal protein L27-domain-containing protein [Paraphysoderma sedebokerense]